MDYHIPALLPEVLEALDIKPDGTYVDVTFGGGGHSRAILDRLGPDGHLYAFDQDAEAVARAFDDSRFTIVHANFRYLTNFMAYYDVDGVDGIIADLGVSFHHFDDPERGFSFRWEDGPLDMRMNHGAERSAADILADIDLDGLSRILRLYGELKNARQVASAIVRARDAGHALRSTADLLDIVRPLIDPRREKKDLACIFQALRIEVNDELGVLRRFLAATTSVLRHGGRLAIITYHSLEDRLVKNFMKSGNLDGDIEKDFFGNTVAPLKPLGSKPIVPGDEEIERNPRSRSAKLRIATLR